VLAKVLPILGIGLKNCSIGLPTNKPYVYYHWLIKPY